MNRRKFIKSGALFVPVFGIFVPKLIRAQGLNTAAFKGAAEQQKVVSGNTLLVNQNFEGAGYDNGESWSEDGTPNEDYTGVVLRGSQSLRCATGEDAYITFSAQTDIYSFADFQLESLPAAGGPYFIGPYLNGASHNTSVRVDFDGNVYLYAGGGDSSASATVLSTGTRYYTWLEVVGGTAKLAMSTTSTKPTSDGSGNVYLTKSADAATITKILCNVSGTASGAAALFDHVLVSTSVIGNNP